MTPLDAARRMAEHPPTVLDSVTNRLHCGYCGQAIARREDHAADCPWLAQGQIVAAMEVAERFVASSHEEPHDNEEDFEALAAMLKGDA